ncbi:MAG TPA: NfeD family protein [Candidatus Hydrogenedentes bacterium]|jgi:membrane-bound serine protease (ClpP class)|nr:NfeD family protein [Candidatus Hydrogenedentota bacterium]HPJ98146.1 NfeD family protein [Candidatus Hydrogenedentota bacterium]
MFRHTAILLILGALYPLALAQGEDAPPHPDSDYGYIIVCTLDGEVDEAMAVFVERIADYAEDAEGVVFIIDTPGGRVDSGLEVTKAIQHAGKFCPTIAYITDGFSASSAGALVAYACKHIVMTSSATIGAAKPIMLTPQGALPGDEKTVSFLRAKFSALAESNGHNPDLAMAMVDEDIELRAFKVGTKVLVKAVDGLPRSTASRKTDALEQILDYVDRRLPLPEELKDAARDLAGEAVGDAESENGTAAVPLSLADAERYGGPGNPSETYPPEGKLVSASGKLLALTASEAREYGLIPDIFDDLEHVLSFFGLSQYERFEYEMTWPEILFRWLTSPTVSSLLLLFGIGGLYLELKTPGFGAPGIAGITCLVIFFGARAVLGLANWLDIALVLVGLGLILLEIFVIPGFGATGVAGIICVVLGIVLSFLLNDWQLPQYQWDYERLTDAAYSLGLSMGLFLIFVAVTWKILPRTPLYGRLVLADEQRAEAGFVAQTDQEEEAAIGLQGVATTMLRPAGRGRFGATTLHVVSRGEFLAPGTPIVVTQVEGNRYVVAPMARDKDNIPREKRSPWISGN